MVSIREHRFPFLVKVQPHCISFEPLELLLKSAVLGGSIKVLSIWKKAKIHRLWFQVNNWNRFNKNSGGTLVEKCCHFFDLMTLIADSMPVRVMASGGQDINHLDESYHGEVCQSWCICTIRGKKKFSTVLEVASFLMIGGWVLILLLIHIAGARHSWQCICSCGLWKWCSWNAGFVHVCWRQPEWTRNMCCWHQRKGMHKHLYSHVFQR